MAISRRSFVGGIAAAAVAAPTARWRLGSFATTGSTQAAAAGKRITGIDISRHPVPFPPNLRRVCQFDQEWLNSLARRYWDEYASHLNRPLNAYDRADFWFRYIAIPLQQKAMLGQSLGTGDGRIEKDLALIHMVGYYGGIWFGKKLDEFLGMSTTASCKTPEPGPTEADFDAMTASLQTSVNTARDGSSLEVLEAAEDALRGGDLLFYLSNGLPTLNGLIGAYAYNVGYTNAILVPDNRALPPPANPRGPSPSSPPWNSFTFKPNGVFDASYPVWADPKTASARTPLPPSRDPFKPVPYLTGSVPALKLSRAKLADAKQHYAAQVDRIKAGRFDRYGHAVVRGDLAAMSQASFNLGTAMWTGVPTLNIRPWDKPSYDLIVALSIFFVQAMQAPGQACIAAAASGNASDARNALMTAAIAAPFGLSYLIALNRGNSEGYACYTADASIPPFTFGD
jgi:hypothetical protein